VIRTTPVTGAFTDLVIMLSAKLRGDTFDNRKTLLFLLIIIEFFVGADLGTYLVCLNFSRYFYPPVFVFSWP
jgi:uncharacterized membrane protein YoaK (UPF0700 family)